MEFLFFTDNLIQGCYAQTWLWLTITKSKQTDQYRLILCDIGLYHWYIPGWWWDIRLGEHYIKNILFGLKCYFIKILFESPLSSPCLPWTCPRERILPEYRQYVQPYSIHNTTVRAGHGDNTGSSTLANIYNINIIYNLQKVSPPHPTPPSCMILYLPHTRYIPL